MLKKLLKRDEVLSLEEIKCGRCGDQKHVNKFNLCSDCAKEVDFEYSQMYQIKTMDY